MSKFETVNFQVRKYLQSMKVGEQRRLAHRLCKSNTIKSTASQLKKLGVGIWKVKIGNTLESQITRIA